MKPRNPLLRLLADCRAHWPGMGAIAALSMLAGGFKALSATFWGRAVDAGVSGATRAMLLSALLMIAFILLDGVRTAVLYHTIGRVTERMFLGLRMRAFSVLTGGDVKALEQRLRSGDLAMRVNGDAESLCDIVAGEFSNNLRLLFQAVVAVSVCLFLSWQLSVAYLILLPVTLWLTRVISYPVQEARKEARGSAGAAMNLASDMLSGMATVKSFAMAEPLQRKFDAALDRSMEQSVRIERRAMALTVVKYASGVFQLMSLFLVGTWLTARGLVSVGNVMSFIALSAYISEALGQLDRMMLILRNAVALSGRLYDIFDIPMEPQGGESPLPDAACVEMRAVRFRYEGDRAALDGITLRVARNQKVALIGPSGCGKSTLVRLICRFYAPTEGELKLFGREKIDLLALRQRLALVTQEAHLFDGTVEDNVRCGRMDASRAEVVAALRDAGLWDFVEGLPNGLDTPIGEFGGRLSGGQRQRLCIARAFLKNAPLVLLDEATSALDTQSERDIQAALDKLLAGRAAVIVAHRLTTVRGVDYIYCLDGGRVVEEGAPAELLGRRGYYHSMCARQGLLDGGAGA
ncbi:MAG: ABC transporter ATP-binding protein [Clostridiales bacterium]|nr:ABC transporter ATP-binding protein [Clostridiales bacterium]